MSCKVAPVKNNNTLRRKTSRKNDLIFMLYGYNIRGFRETAIERLSARLIARCKMGCQKSA